MNHDLENSMVVGATEAYEAAHKEPYGLGVLEEAAELLGSWLYQDRNYPSRVSSLPELIRHAKGSIYEALMDNPDEMLDAVVMSADGDYGASDKLLKKFIRTYAEAHLSALVEYFQIDTGENRE
jgi:hypothetical protein